MDIELHIFYSGIPDTDISKKIIERDINFPFLNTVITRT